MIRAFGALCLAGVLGQCTALAHLNLNYNLIGEAGAKRLTASWSRPEGGLTVYTVDWLWLDSEDSDEESEEESDDEAKEEEDCEAMSIRSIRVPEWQQPITDFFERVHGSSWPHTLVA